MNMKKQYINPLTTAMAVVSNGVLMGSGSTTTQGTITTGDAPVNNTGGAAPGRRVVMF